MQLKTKRFQACDVFRSTKISLSFSGSQHIRPGRSRLLTFSGVTLHLVRCPGYCTSDNGTNQTRAGQSTDHKAWLLHVWVIPEAPSFSVIGALFCACLPTQLKKICTTIYWLSSLLSFDVHLTQLLGVKPGQPTQYVLKFYHLNMLMLITFYTTQKQCTDWP